MKLTDGVTLLATICNTTRNAVPFTLWMARGDRQYLVDLSDALNQVGDVGLTGMAWHGGKLYLAVQSSLSSRILVLDRHLAVIGALRSPEFLDLHSLHVSGEDLIAVSTGRASVVRMDSAGHSSLVCRLDGTPHVNAAVVRPTQTLICCQSAGQVVAGAQSGGVIDVGQNTVLIDGLGHPHSLMPCGDGFIVLDSSFGRLIHFDATGTRQDHTLGGFLRGCSLGGGTLYVASSTRRTVSRKRPDASVARSYWEDLRQPVRIFALDPTSFAVTATYQPLVAGFEIYELLALEDEIAIDPSSARFLEPDANMLAQVFYEAAKFAYAEQARLAAPAG